jgi:hypothetical protein
VEWTQRHEPARDRHPAEDPVKPLQIQLVLDAGIDVTTRGGQIVGLRLVGCGQQRQELVLGGW